MNSYGLLQAKHVCGAALALAIWTGAAGAAPTGFVTQTIQLGKPAIGLAYDDAGVLFALLEAGFGNNSATLRQILPDGSFGASSEVIGDDPDNFFTGGMTYDHLADRLLITDNTADGRIYAITDGVQSTIATGLPAIAGIAVRDSGEIFVSTALGGGQGGVYQIDRTTGAATSVMTGLDYGAGLAFDPSGNLLVQDAASVAPYLGRLQRLPITEESGALTFEAPELVLENATAAAGVLVDDEGDVFITGSGGIYEVAGEPASASLFYSNGNPSQFATAITLSPGVGAFEPFAGGVTRVAAVADYGFTLEEPFITLFTPAEPEDFNSDGVVDSEDLAVWSQHFGESADSPSTGDANQDGVVDGADFLRWQRSLGSSQLLPTVPVATVPEPTAHIFVLTLTMAGAFAQRHEARRCVA